MHPEEPTTNYQPVYTPLTDPSRQRHRIIAAVLIFAFVLLIIIGLVSVLSGKKGGAEEYARLTAQNQELIRILDDHGSSAAGLDSQNYIARAEILLATADNDLQSLLAEVYGTAVTKEIAALAANPEIDIELESADNRNRFDNDFLGIFTLQMDGAQRSVDRLLETEKIPRNIDVLTNLQDAYENLQTY